jgi:quercetin dioxygenase-like cupin family protein
MHYLRNPLDCENHGVNVVDVEPGWSDDEHDHADEREATVTIEGKDVPMEAGDVVRVPPDTTRQIQNGDTESRFVLTGAP